MKEIILVDDQSTLDFLGEQLDEYVLKLPIHTKVIRMEERLGLIKARLRGAEAAQVNNLELLENCSYLTSNFVVGRNYYIFGCSHRMHRSEFISNFKTKIITT